MKLDYASLISPFPFLIKHVGSIKSPTLKEIWDPKVTYPVYQSFLAFLSMTPRSYCEDINPERLPWYQSLSEDQTLSLTMMDLIPTETPLQQYFSQIFTFFFVEQVVWDPARHLFLVFQENFQEKGKNPVVTGCIRKEDFPLVCSVILQRCCISQPEAAMDPAKISNKRALQILKKLQKGRLSQSRSNRHDPDMELPNLISAIVSVNHSLNYSTIWDLTVYQLYDLFQREQNNVYFRIQQMSVAAWGNSKHTFQGTEWFKST